MNRDSGVRNRDWVGLYSRSGGHISRPYYIWTVSLERSQDRMRDRIVSHEALIVPRRRISDPRHIWRNPSTRDIYGLVASRVLGTVQVYSATNLALIPIQIFKQASTEIKPRPIFLGGRPQVYSATNLALIPIQIFS